MNISSILDLKRVKNSTHVERIVCFIIEVKAAGCLLFHLQEKSFIIELFGLGLISETDENRVKKETTFPDFPLLCVNNFLEQKKLLQAVCNYRH